MMKCVKKTVLLLGTLSLSIYVEEASCTVSPAGESIKELQTSTPSTDYNWQEWMEDQVEWDELTDAQREFLISRRWTEDYWDCGADEESLYEWHELSPERQLVWTVRGFDEETWDNAPENPCLIGLLMSTPEEFNPVVVNITVPQLDEITLERLSKDETEIRLVDGGAAHTSEVFATSMALGHFISKVKSGDKDLYMHLEEGMREKKLFQELVGDRIKEHLLDAVKKHAVLKSEGIWKSKWEVLGQDSYDWAMFLGAKGSQTTTHYDSDLFNFLYVVEGRKRVIIIPNDERTQGAFETVTNEDGGTAWGKINALDRSVPLPEHAIEMEVGPGQGIAIPYVAWHAVENLETSLAYSLRIVD
jgi:mannose-6-phosphate isomerase-like protein (cupin superfamily)